MMWLPSHPSSDEALKRVDLTLITNAPETSSYRWPDFRGSSHFARQDELIRTVDLHTLCEFFAHSKSLGLCGLSSYFRDQDPTE